MITVSLEGQDTVRAALNGISDPQIIRRAVNAMAESYVDDTHDYIQQGRAFKDIAEHQLKNSINWRPTGNDSAEVYANAAYARYVEFGTGIYAGHTPWVIRPRDGRKALQIPIGGGRDIYRRAVTHHGSRPFPFFYADQEHRKQNMLNRAISVIQGVI